MVVDLSCLDIDFDKYEMDQDWMKFHGTVTEDVPDNIPEPLGKEFIMRAYVDADHVGDKLTRQYHTWYFVFLNMAPIY